jgi:hypothetical protein
MIFKTPAECGIKMKVVSNLLHCNGVNLNDNLLSTISAVFERVGVWLHELLIITLYLQYELRPFFTKNSSISNSA